MISAGQYAMNMSYYMNVYSSFENTLDGTECLVWMLHDQCWVIFHEHAILHEIVLQL